MPLSLWTDDDIWEFIRTKNIRIADDYSRGKIELAVFAAVLECNFPTTLALNFSINITQNTTTW